MPPVIEQCPKTLIFFPEDNENVALVHWFVPKVTDNNDFRLKANQVSGPSPGSLQGVGTYTITYEAEDSAGNKAECSFQVVVKRKSF